jgi:DNA-directed RNA polymerase specialized sigma24 family protein
MVIMQQVLNAGQRTVAGKTDRGPARQHGRFGATGMGSVTQGNDGWRRLRQLHATPLLAFTLRLAGGDQVRAEAIVQHTLLLAWRNADRLGEIGTLRPWLMTTARRVAAGQEAAVHELLFAMDDAGREDNLARVEAAVGRLAPEQRAVLAEVHAGRRSVSAAARSAGVSTGVVKSRVFQALETLQPSVWQRRPAH